MHPHFVHPGHHLFFIGHGFVHPRLGSTVIVVNPRPVWVRGFWWWNGFQWLWVPGRWAQ